MTDERTEGQALDAAPAVEAESPAAAPVEPTPAPAPSATAPTAERTAAPVATATEAPRATAPQTTPPDENGGMRLAYRQVVQALEGRHGRNRYRGPHRPRRACSSTSA